MPSNGYPAEAVIFRLRNSKEDVELVDLEGDGRLWFVALSGSVFWRSVHEERRSFYGFRPLTRAARELLATARARGGLL